MQGQEFQQQNHEKLTHKQDKMLNDYVVNSSLNNLKHQHYLHKKDFQSQAQISLENMYQV